jgi:putative hydrolase of the HAD superfamily
VPGCAERTGRYPRTVTYRAVFFDAGETLVHPHPSFAELFTLVLHREGFDVDPAVVGDSMHVISERFLEAESDMWTTSPERSRAFWYSVYQRLLEHLGVPNPNGLADRLYGEFTDLSNYRLFPDVEDTISRLRGGGLLLGVVSNFEAWLEQLLESLGVASSFDVRVISGVEGMEKPDPAIFRLALDRAGVAPQESVYVGDNPDFDTRPAERLGMLAVLIDRRGRHADHSGLRITTLDDLPSVIGLER